ncbi:hypothetical protein [Flavobacterium sp.]|uniref:hypothetical protein n=1 Tax=Flavobacterium sp. TaxID=239 RepID=UPI0026282774|nr:hypothetical protein [Flavobacterium sp.]
MKAQSVASTCNFEYKLQTISCPVETSVGELFATLNWDFSTIKKGTIKIEVVPIKDCNKSTNAQFFKDKITLNIDGNEYKKVDTKVYKHTDLMAKCFKWRVVINTNDCEKKSDWQFYSFIKNKK